MRTIRNTTLNNDEYVEAGENKNKKCKELQKDCTWKPMKLSEGTEDIPIIPLFDCIERMESQYTEEMNTFMKKHCISKSLIGPGGQLNGPWI